MEALLITKDLYEAISGEYDEDISQAEMNLTDRKARAQIMLHLGQNIIRKVKHHSSAKEVWDALEDLFLKKMLPKRSTLSYALFNFRMNTALTLDENVKIFNKLVHDLKLVKVEYDDSDLVNIILNSLPDEFDGLIDAIDCKDSEPDL
jgi:hypothetical protein